MTRVEEIYDVFLSNIEDDVLALLYNHNLRELLHKYLLGAIVGFKKCKKDLTIKDYSLYTFNMSAGDDEFIIPENVDVNNIEIIGVDTKESYVFTYLEDERKIIVDYALSENSVISIYNDGYFEDDLSVEEIYILAMGMICYWLNTKVNREENLTQIISDGDYKRLSGANMLDKLIKLKQTTDENFRLATIDYSYNSFKGFN